MKFSTRQDIGAPIGTVFEAASDFARFERQARRRGVDIRRTDHLKEVQTGMRWSCIFQMRGKERKVRAELFELTPDEMIRITGASSGIDLDFDAAFMALSPQRTRMKIGLELRPRTMQARLLIQSMKFAKANLDKRFADRIANFAREFEASQGRKFDPLV